MTIEKRKTVLFQNKSNIQVVSLEFLLSDGENDDMRRVGIFTLLDAAKCV